MATWIWIIIIVVVALIVAIVATMAARKSRTSALRRQFGPEYDRTLDATQDQRVAEAALRERQRQRARLDIKPLPEASRARFSEEWRGIQERFVDSPGDAVAAAGTLVREVMTERGYPPEHASAQADLLSVDYPEVTEGYRAADAVQQRAQLHQATTEDLRDALVKYRAMFEALAQVEPTADSAGPAATGADATAASTEAPEAEAPAGETPAAEAPAGEAPAGEARAAEAPVREEPAAAEPGAAQPAAATEPDRGSPNSTAPDSTPPGSTPPGSTAERAAVSTGGGRGNNEVETSDDAG